MRHLFVSILSIIILTAFAQQDQIPFKKYGVPEGLPEEAIRAIVQDDQGYIWISTQLGAARFDGYDFTTYGNDFDNPNGLQLSLTGGGMIKGKDGKLWIGGNLIGGIASYDPKTKSFNNYLYTTDSTSKVPFSYCTVLFEDSHRNIWFSNSSFELDSTIICRLDQQTNAIYHYPSAASFGKVNNILMNYGIAESKKDSSIWMVEQSGPIRGSVVRLDRAKDQFETILRPGQEIPGTNLSDTISDIVPMGKSQLFVLSTEDLVVLWDPIELKSVHHFRFKNDRSGGWSAFEDQRGFIWICVRDGFHRYEVESDQLKTYSFSEGELDHSMLKKEGLFPRPVFQSNDEIWFDVNSNGPDSYLRFEYASDAFTLYDATFNFEENTEINQIVSLFLIDFSNTKWFGTRPNLYKEDAGKRKIDWFRAKDDKKSLPSDSITTLMEDSKGQLWIGSKGLSVFNDANGTFKNYTHNPKDSQSIPSNNIVTLLEDHIGQIWIATTNGLAIYNPDQESFKRLFENEGQVMEVIQDKKNSIWVSIINKGVYELDVHGNILSFFNPEDDKGLTSNAIFEIFEDSDGNIWLGDGTERNVGLFKYDRDKKIFQQFKFANLQDNQIRWITEDDFGNIWVGSDEQLKKYDPGNNSFTSFGNPREGFFAQPSFSADENGNFWIGTYGGAGLINISPESGEYKAYGEEQGLLSNIIRNYGEMPQDKNGNIYIASDRGLTVFNTVTNECQNFTSKDGFQESGRYFESIVRKNGEIWMGGYNGLNRIDPTSIIEEKNSIPPKVWITSMTIMDSNYSAPDGDIFTKAIDYTDEIEIAYWQKDISFDFVALHYLRPEDNQYSWKLEGYDKVWSKPSLIRNASYTNLSPGTYTFRVKGSNSDGIWNEEGDFIKIKIHPPIWLTSGAYASYGILFIIGIFGVHRFQKDRTIRIERERIKDEQLAQAQEIEKAYDQLKETQSQLIHAEKMASLGELTAGIAHEIQNPLNFVNNFSDLNNELLDDLKKAIDANDQAEIEAIYKDLKENESKINHHGRRAEEIVKSMLQHSRGGNGEKEPVDINLLADEYLRLAYHGLRAKDKSFNAEFKVELDEKLPEIQAIPQDIGRVLLNLINNAFQAVKAVNKPEVVVSTKLLDNQVVIRVADNGTGIPDSVRDKIFQPFFTTKAAGEGTGLGLSMSYEIITKGHGGTLEVESEEGKGTSFIFKLPITN